jgi:hypothetical protein
VIRAILSKDGNATQRFPLFSDCPAIFLEGRDAMNRDASISLKRRAIGFDQTTDNTGFSGFF